MVDDRNIIIRFLQPAWVVFVYLFLYIPIFVLVLFSFNKKATAVTWTGFTLKWYKKLFATPEMLEAFKTSIIIAVASTILSIVIGAALVFASRWWRSSWQFTLFKINIIFPEIMVAIGLLSLFSFLRIPLGYNSIIAGHTLIGLGFVVPILRARFVEIDPLLIEASADLGATNSQTFWKIVVPLLTPAILVSGLLVFTLSLDDFLIAFFCSGASIETLSVYVYSLVREGVNPTINAISTILLALSSVFILIVYRLKIINTIIEHE